MEGKWSHAKERQQQQQPPPPLTGTPHHLQRVSRLYLTATRCVLTDLLFSTTDTQRNVWPLIRFSSEEGLQTFIPENALENFMGSSVASVSNETSIRNGLSP